MLRREIENVLVQLYPRAIYTINITSKEGWVDYLHCNDSVIDGGFFGEKICADSGFVLGTELFVYLLQCQWDDDVYYFGETDVLIH